MKPIKIKTYTWSGVEAILDKKIKNSLTEKYSLTGYGDYDVKPQFLEPYKEYLNNCIDPAGV